MSEEKKNYSLSTILIIGLTVCVLFLLFSVTIFRYQLNKIFEARCEKIRATGGPITLQELSQFYGEVPDDENAALIYEDVFTLYKDTDVVYDMYVKEMTAKGIPEDKREFKTKSSFQDKILSLGCDVTLITGNELPDKVKDATRMFLNANKRCLELSRQLEQYSKCQFNLDFSKGYDMRLPHLSPSRAFAKLLAVDMTYNSFKGDLDRVLLDFKEGMKLGKYLSNEPILISYMFGNAIDKVLVDALKNSYSVVQFSDLQLEEIENIIKEHIKLSGRYRVYIGERVFCIRTPFLLYNYHKFSMAKKVLFKVSLFFGFDILWKLKFLDFFDELFKIERETDFTKKRKLLDTLEKQYINLSFIYEPVKPVVSAIFSIPEFNMIAKLTTALIAIEIERYKLKYHKLPKSLNDLVPEFFEKLPIDPFSGKSYKYRVGKFEISVKETFYHPTEKKLNGFIVYSVGTNGVDDNGKENYRHGDIVYWVVDKKKL